MNEGFDIYHQLGRRITYLRKLKNMSSLNLAIEADLNKNYLNDIENGRRNPTLLVLKKIAMALDISLETLFQGVRDYTLKGETLTWEKDR